MKITINLSGILLIALVFIYGCSKFDLKILPQQIISNSIDSTSDSSCTITAKILDTSKSLILQGICWDTVSSPTYNKNTGFYKIDSTNHKIFTVCFSGLSPRTRYYARAFGVSKDSVYYGNQLTFITPAKSPFTYGQYYAGGYVFYIDSTGNHGLVCDTVDLKYYSDSIHISDSIQWSGVTGKDNSGANATAIGTGATNTQKIIATYANVTNAASLCTNYNGGGYNDWFLPSKDELNQLFLNLTAKGVGNMSATNYWSSSNYISKGIAYAWAQYFSNGNQYYFNEYFYLNVRAVRAF